VAARDALVTARVARSQAKAAPKHSQSSIAALRGTKYGGCGRKASRKDNLQSGTLREADEWEGKVGFVP
jgi:hypothetical protein